MYAEAILKKGEGRTLKSGGAWVYDNEIDRVEGDYENGDILAVKDFDGFFLGWGFINTRSKITIRVMSRRKEHEITEEFLEKRDLRGSRLAAGAGSGQVLRRAGGGIPGAWN